MSVEPSNAGESGKHHRRGLRGFAYAGQHHRVGHRTGGAPRLRRGASRNLIDYHRGITVRDVGDATDRHLRTSILEAAERHRTRKVPKTTCGVGSQARSPRLPTDTLTSFGE